MKTKIKTLLASLLAVGFMAGASGLVWNGTVSVNEPVLVAEDDGCGPPPDPDPGGGGNPGDNMPNEIPA